MLNSTRDAGQPELFNLGVGELVDGEANAIMYHGFILDGCLSAGLDAAIGKMSLGQRCEIEIDAPFHYGKLGWAPMVPEECTLVYSVELLAFDEPLTQ